MISPLRTQGIAPADTRSLLPVSCQSQGMLPHLRTKTDRNTGYREERGDYLEAWTCELQWQYQPAMLAVILCQC